MKTLKQVLTEYRDRGNKTYYKAMVAVRDEVEAETVHHSKLIIDREKVTLKEVRFAVDFLECLAERG